MRHERSPGEVPPQAGRTDLWNVPPDVTAGFDTDGDGRADTAVTADGGDLVLLTDLDGDGFADRLLRIGPDGVVREVSPERPVGPGNDVVDGLLGGVDLGSDGWSP